MTAPDRPARAPHAFLSGTLLSGLVIKVPCNRAGLERRLRTLGPLTLASDERNSPTYPVYCELWNIHDGGLRIGDLDQHDVAELAGEAAGAVLGALAGAWAGAFGALRTAPAEKRSERTPRQAFVSSVAQGSRSGTKMMSSFWRSCSHTIAAAVGTYHELCMWVPRVSVPDVREPHSFILGMVTDGELAAFADRALGYGYNKRRGRFDVASPHAFTVHDGEEGQVVSFSATGTAKRLSHFAGIAELESSFQDPLLGVTPSGRFVSSRLARSLATASHLEMLSGELRVARGFFPGGRSHYTFSDSRRKGGWRVLRFENLRAEVGYPAPLFSRH